ncbi:HAD family hydrolase [Chiayiivirga flava]|uniref:Putative hydrolase of the HAD superfamily n=1 Tax=Chiayiivirga flava TaxID=659595 RepID=A0A7W8G0Z6_9GAMM|nr:HAD family hydrolase [Chiayiivirga flava]MBB5209676.1 putative hydrolase of the HAD superfamily [Chiayiivirga flava]
MSTTATEARPASAIVLVGFDADDTLWHSEGYFQAAHAEFERILGDYVDLADAHVHDRLLAAERRNLGIFGYGAKGMVLSMIETAIELTAERISAHHLHRLVVLGKDILTHPVELLPDVRAAVEAVAATHRIVLITKGDLFHQEAKIAQSGLADLFTRIEIVSDKTPGAYARVIGECGAVPERFAMIGNSLRSDIEPVLGLGGWGVHVPYHVTWAHELEHGLRDDEPRLLRIDGAAQIPQAIARLEARAHAS